jgi:hypothetical protein
MMAFVSLHIVGLHTQRTRLWFTLASEIVDLAGGPTRIRFDHADPGPSV